MEKLDYKKAFKDLYLPGTTPTEVRVPPMGLIMVDGRGDPNGKDGEFQRAVELLYTLSFTIKMSKMSGLQPKGYFEYVVPPLEGLWWMSGLAGLDFSRKDEFCWTAMIRQPDFVNEDVFQWACDAVKRKKPDVDVAKARFQSIEEGLCVQAMHIGPYDAESRTLAAIESYIMANGLKSESGKRSPDGVILRHHEIYLSDPRRTAPAKLKTVLRHPVRQ